MTMENNGREGDQTNEPSGPTAPGGGSPAQEPTFDVDGRPMTASQLVETARRYKGLEPEFTRRSQRLAELEAVLGEYGQATGPGPGPETPELYGNPPVDYGYRQNSPPYTPQAARPVNYGYNPGMPQEQGEVDPIQERLDMLDANMEAIAFAQRNRWITDDQMRQVLAVRDRMEAYYKSTIPLDSAKDRWLVEASERESMARAAAEVERTRAEEYSKQAQLAVEQARQATAEQKTTGQMTPGVLPGQGGQEPPPQPSPTTWEEIAEQFYPIARELASSEGIPE